METFSWTLDMNMQISEMMMSSPHNFILFTEMNAKSPILSYEDVNVPCIHPE